MKEANTVQVTFLGKAVLGVMLSLIKNGDYQEAHNVWRKDDKSIEGIGLGYFTSEDIFFKEPDLFLFCLLNSYCWMLSNNESAMFKYLDKALKIAENESSELKLCAINHWFFYTYATADYLYPNRFTPQLESLINKFGSPDIEKIMSHTVTQNGVNRYYHAKFASYFPDQAKWETPSEAVVFAPGGVSIDVGLRKVG